MTTIEVETAILRLHHAEHWPVGTVASQLGIHTDVVRRVLGLDEPWVLAAPPAADWLTRFDRSRLTCCNATRACARRGSTT